MSADRPGFIVNRILMPFLAEAMRAFEQGVGTAEDIDTGARVGLNHPMGPLELADFIGLDVCLGSCACSRTGSALEHMRPPRVLVELVEAGHLGQKTGQGFYTYPRDEGEWPRAGAASARRSGCSRRRRASSRSARSHPSAIERDEDERFDRSIFAADGRAGADRRRRFPESRRRRGVLVPRLDAGHGGARGGRHGHRR